jgi:hypothetical protein
MPLTLRAHSERHRRRRRISSVVRDARACVGATTRVRSIHLACCSSAMRGLPAMAGALLAAGADPTLRNVAGATAEDLARRFGQTAVAQAIVTHAAAYRDRARADQQHAERVSNG